MNSNPLMDGIERFRHQLAKLDAEYEERKCELLSQVETFRSYVNEGDSSGDSITDYFLSGYSTLDEEVAQPLRELANQMRGKEGQLFLVIENTRKRFRYGGGGEREYLFQAEHCIGALAGENLSYKGMKNLQAYGIPCERHWVVGTGGVLDSRIGSFFFPLGTGVHGTNEVVIGTQKKVRYSVIIGDEEVFQVAKRTIGKVAFARVLDELGRGREIPPE